MQVRDAVVLGEQASEVSPLLHELDAKDAVGRPAEGFGPHQAVVADVQAAVDDVAVEVIVKW